MNAYDQAVAALRENDEQWQAFESSGHCVVLAGPGSGKTRTLTTKMARLLREIRSPRGVACVTYSTECARELRRRLDALGVEESDRAFVGTLHGFCLRHILGVFGHVAGHALADQLRVAKESQRLAAMSAAMKDVHAGGVPERLLNDVDKLRKTRIDRTPEKGWDPAAPLERLCVAYEGRMREQALLDFDMIVLDSLELVERNAWLRKALRARFPVLVIDEYQDLGIALHRLVDALCFGAGVRLFAVGDADQSIYGFTGAKPELLQEVAARDEVETIRLRLNYRSGNRLVQAASSVLQEPREYVSTRGDIGDIHFHTYRDFDSQVEALVSDVLPDILGRVDAGDVVILYPTRNEASAVETALADAGYEYVRLGRDAAYPRTPLTRLIEELAEWCVVGWKTGKPRVSRLISRWISLLRVLEPQERRAEVRRLIRFLFDHRDEAATARAWLDAMNDSVIAHGQCRAHLETVGELENFEKLRNAATDGPLAAFTVRNLAGQAGSPTHVNLMTLHSSKGCEFRAVIIVGGDEGRLPSGYATAPGAIREARRLFYVGVSRAEDEVHLFSSVSQESRFVKELRISIDGE
jgi:superfamily I DNA/RNA helicase